MGLQTEKPRSKALGFRMSFPEEETKLLEIERRCFPIPWTRDEFRSDFHLVVAFVAGDPDNVVGYCATRRVGDAIVIDNFAIDRNLQRQGYGRQMLSMAAGFAPAMGPLRLRRTTKPAFLRAWVWERNVAAQQFFKACGFRAAVEMRNFYDEHAEAFDDSAILFLKPIGGVEYSKFPLVARVAQ